MGTLRVRYWRRKLTKVELRGFSFPSTLGEKPYKRYKRGLVEPPGGPWRLIQTLNLL